MNLSFDGSYRTCQEHSSVMKTLEQSFIHSRSHAKSRLSVALELCQSVTFYVYGRTAQTVSRIVFS